MGKKSGNDSETSNKRIICDVQMISFLATVLRNVVFVLRIFLTNHIISTSSYGVMRRMRACSSKEQSDFGISN